ncbi:MAG: hypothetical protein RI907_1957, partial [Pseudomonadota bacterium]
MNPLAVLRTLKAIQSSQPWIEFSPDGQILDANALFLSLMGYHLDEVKGRHHRLFVQADIVNSPTYPAFWQALQKGEAQSAEFPRLTKGGEVRWLQATYAPVVDSLGRVQRVIKLAHDITTRKEAEAESRAKLQAIQASHATIEFAMDGTILDANPAFLSLMGYTLPELRGKKHARLVDEAYRQSAEYQAFWDI